MDSIASYDPSEDPKNSDILASITSSALEAIATAINDSWSEWDGNQIPGDSGTIIDPIDGNAASPDEGSYILVSLATYHIQ